MMILAVLAQVAIAPVALAPLVLDLGELPQQTLQSGHCVTFLWTRTEPPRRVAMADETARTLRIVRGRKSLDLASAGQGLYAIEGLSITLDLDIADREGVTNGAIINQGAMRVEEAGKDSVVVPVGGIRACQ